MEKNTVQFVLMVALMLGLLIGESTASCNDECSKKCKVYHPRQDLKECVGDCLKTCNPPNDAVYFCKLGCASSLCANGSTPEKVQSCVDSCSKMCTKI
ncbi:hypothetical protein WN944_022141 [Citrus x changshan-huyou]|uniref:Thionin-like protein 2 n=3 Tax=Citrus TaxID=2706 RepID=A0ACB8JAC7_CITSI|nr:Thionin-like protein 2 [Citrus sinensis]KDO48839.1 hypothetical protein CISIN_1g037796mg [Citrus sinensis]